MKALLNKKVLIIVFIFLGLFLLIFLSSGKKQTVDTGEQETDEIKEYVLIFPEPDPYPQESITPDDLIDVVISNYTGNNSEVFCDVKEDGTKYEINDREGYRDDSKYFDLNSDGVDEILIFPVEICGFIIRGASGNGPIYVFQKNNEEWVKIGDLEGNLLRAGPDKTNGYYNLNTNYHMSAYSGFDYFYEFKAQSDSETGSYQKVSEESYNDIEVQK